MTVAQLRMPAKLVPVFEGTADTRGAFGGRGSGKCLGAGTMILRADASLVAVEDVRKGDWLLGPDGRPRLVLSTTAGVGPLYQVTQKTGCSYIVNDAHILVLERSDSAKTDYGSVSIAGNRQRPNGRYARYETGQGYSLITAAEYAEKPERFKAQHFGFRRVVVGEHKALPIDPYLLGLWLGDGSEKAPEITNIDPEIVAYLRRIALSNDWLFTEQLQQGKTPRYYIGSRFQRRNSLVRQLRLAGVFGNKHIPETYFNSSISQRRALLAGLVDTDGHVSNGCIEISQARQELLDQIIRLAHGLGLKASKRYKAVRCNGRVCDSWKTQIGGDIDQLPLLIERKRLAAQVKKNKDWRRSRVDIAPIGIGTYYGFELDGDHLFMLADGTVTHNTRTFAKMTAVRALMWSQVGEEGIILCGRQFMNSLADSSLEEIKMAIREEPWLAPHFDIGENYVRTLDRRINYVFRGLDRNIDSVKSTSRVRLAWIDEAEPVTEEAWVKLIPTLREEDSELWLTWNSEVKRRPTNQRFRETRPTNSKIVEINWRDNPFFPASLNRKRLDDLEQRPDSYAHIWEGDYATAITGAYYSKQIAEARAQGRVGLLNRDPLMTIRAVWDIGGTGLKADATAIWIVQYIGRELRFLDYYEAKGQPLAAHVAWLRANGYGDALCVLPHDGAAHEKIVDSTYEGALRAAGFSVTVVPNQGAGAAMMRVETARRMFGQMTFDAVKTAGGLETIGNYRSQISSSGVDLGPRHDEFSHGGDAFGLAAVAYEPPKVAVKIDYGRRGVF